MKPDADAGIDSRIARVAALRPALVHPLNVLARRDGGQRWYLLHEPLGGTMLRLDRTAWSFVGRLDGSTTVEQAAMHAANDVDGLSTIADALPILARLHASGLLVNAGERSVAELETLAHRQATLRRRGRLFGWLSLRLPLIDPDRLLARTVAATLAVQRTDVWRALLVFVALGALAIAAAAPTLLAETAAAVERVSTWFVYLLSFVVLKALHEFAHGVVLKRYGGGVHEAGIALLVLLPVPYVDASASWRLPSARERRSVAGAGMLAELAVATLALPLWMLTESGALHDAAGAIVVTAAIGTCLFNANPLLKFDGYFLLEDVLGLPNLAARSATAWAVRVRRHVLGNSDLPFSERSGRDEAWLLGWGALALPFRIAVGLVIAGWLAERLGTLGWLLGLLALGLPARPLILALVRWLRLELPHTERVRTGQRALLLGGLPVALLTLWPMPSTLLADGVVWVSDAAQIHAPFDGIVVAVHRQPGERVRTGDPLLTLDSAALDRDLAVIDSKLAAIETRRVASGRGTEVQRAAAAAERAALRERRGWIQARRDARLVSATVDGVFTPSHSGGALGRHFAAGTPIGLVVDTRQLIVRLVLPADRRAFELESVRQLTVRLADAPEVVHVGRQLRERREADDILPSAALGVPAGGRLPVMADDPSGRASERPLRHLELRLDSDTATAGVGQRAWVRIGLPSESLAERWLRAWRQLFLERLPF